MRKLAKKVPPALLPATVLLLAWYALRGFGEQQAPMTFNRFVLPYPHEIAQAFVEEWRALIHAAWETLRVAMFGYALAAAGGFLAALPAAVSPYLRRMLEPWATALQMFPIIVLAPIYVLWFGEGLPGVLAVTFTMGFFPVFAASVQGLCTIPAAQRELFQLYRASRLNTLYHLQIPSARAHLKTGLHIAATLAIIGTLTGELFAGSGPNGTGGLGFLVIVFKAQGKIPELYAAALTACLLGFTFIRSVQILFDKFPRSSKLIPTTRRTDPGTAP
jgi:NitT/TauT family transport system permease protein